MSQKNIDIILENVLKKQANSLKITINDFKDIKNSIPTPPSNSKNDDENSHFLTNINLFSFSYFGCLQQLFLLRCWVSNLTKLPKIQKKKIWEICSSVPEFIKQNVEETNNKVFMRNPDFRKSIEKYSANPLSYIVSITLLFSAIGFLVETNFIVNEYTFPNEPIFVFKTQNENNIDKKKNKNKNTYTSTTSTISNPPSPSLNKDQLIKSPSLPSIPLRSSHSSKKLSKSSPSSPPLSINNRKSLKKSQRYIPTLKKMPTSKNDIHNEENSDDEFGQICSPISNNQLNISLDEFDSDEEDYFKDESNYGYYNNKKVRKSKSYTDFVPSISPTKEILGNYTSEDSTPTLISDNEIESENFGLTESIESLSSFKNISVHDNLFSIKNYGNTNIKKNHFNNDKNYNKNYDGLSLLSESASSIKDSILSDSKDTLIDLANLAASTDQF